MDIGLAPKKKKDFNVIGRDEPSRGAGGGPRSHQLGTFSDSDHGPGNGSALRLFQLSVEGNKPDFDASSLAVLVVHEAVLI